MKHLVILSYGASGTNALVDQLFNNDHIWVHDYKEPLNLTAKHNRNNKLKNGFVIWTDHLKNLLKKAGDQKLLIHIKPWQLADLNISLEKAIDFLKDDFEFIFMERENYLAIICSSAFKPNSGEKKTTTKAYINANLKIFKNMSDVNSTLKYLIKDYNHICLTYKDHITPGPKIGADIITKHFDIHHEYDYNRYRTNYHAKKNKWSDIKLCDKIMNFKELEKEFNNTPYQWMLWE